MDFLSEVRSGAAFTFLGKSRDMSGEGVEVRKLADSERRTVISDCIQPELCNQTSNRDHIKLV
jgi:hypothetical protein